MSGSVSRDKNDPSQSLQMIGRSLMTPDELKSLPKGHFVVMKTDVYPMRVKLKLFFKWGIEFDENNPYTVEDNVNRKVEYASRREFLKAILLKHRPEDYEKYFSSDTGDGGGVGMVESMNHKPATSESVSNDSKKRSGSGQSEDPRFHSFDERTAEKQLKQEVTDNE